MRDCLARLGREERGAAAVEYALVAALVSATLVATLTGVGLALRERVDTAVQAIIHAGR